MPDVSPRPNTLQDAPAALHAWTWGVFLLLTLALLALYQTYRDFDPWAQWLGYPLPETHAFGETIRASIFRTRANTWSNLGYVLVGFYTLAYAIWDTRRPTTPADPYAVRRPALIALFGVACVILGIGSGLMHAAFTSWSHKADVFGMFIVLTTLIALQWARHLPRAFPAARVLGPIAVVVPAGFIAYPGPFGGYERIFIALIATSFLCGILDTFRRLTRQQFRWPLLAIASFLLAYAIWNLDKDRRFTHPDVWFQGHALWHLLTAVTLGAMANFYRTETPRTPDAND
jgi:hypothetical protein